MCAIVDNDVVGEVFGDSDSPAGRKFFNWLNGGRGRLVVGGKLLDELAESQAFREWASTAARVGRMTTLNREKVQERTCQIEHKAMHESNDPHVLAVAQLSGVRLLFTNDQALGRDFKSKSLIDKGRVYHTRDIRSRNDNKSFSKAHQRLLSGNVCRS